MPTSCPMAHTVLSLPGSALLCIFQLVCDSCPPHAPGTCWLALVCKQWQGLACSVKGLGVVFQGDQQQQADSFCAWLRRHVHQVVALAIINLKHTQQVLAVLAQAAAEAAAAAAPESGAAAAAAGAGAGRTEPPLPPAAAGDGALPLRRLVISTARWMDLQVCQGTLRPLLAALPHLQHLHLPRMVLSAAVSQEEAVLAVDAYPPLQHSTGLTSLVLEGLFVAGDLGAAHMQLPSRLPTTLRSLDWEWIRSDDPRGLSFSHLTALTRLRLRFGCDCNLGIPDVAFTALRQLRQLELWHVATNDALLLAHKEQLVALEPTTSVGVLGQLSHLQSLELSWDAEGKDLAEDLLPTAPALKQLAWWRYWDEQSGAEAWALPWKLRLYSGLHQLQRLRMHNAGVPPAAPLELCTLTQLKQLVLHFSDTHLLRSGALVSWVCVLAGLVNLEVLSLPGNFIECPQPWLTGLTSLVVLNVDSLDDITDTAAAAAHISRLLAPDPSSNSDPGSSSSSSSSSSSHPYSGRVRIVCLDQKDNYAANMEVDVRLHSAVTATVAMLPPHSHLFRASWDLLQQCGVELWPAPVAARLQQLQLV